VRECVCVCVRVLVCARACSDPVFAAGERRGGGWTKPSASPAAPHFSALKFGDLVPSPPFSLDRTQSADL
jgi:hypothetical protein